MTRVRLNGQLQAPEDFIPGWSELEPERQWDAFWAYLDEHPILVLEGLSEPIRWTPEAVILLMEKGSGVHD